MCCGNKRSALNTNGVAEEGTIKLLYYGHAAMSVRGPVTGQMYQFSRTTPTLVVDVRDAVSMLRTRLFRQTR
jgi:hypothetical protein